MRRKQQRYKKRIEKGFQQKIQQEERQQEGQIQQVTYHAQQHALRTYGVVVDVQKSIIQNAIYNIANTPVTHYFDNPNNVAFHNLCTSIQVPPHIKSLLGLGLNYCIIPRKTKPEYADYKRFERDIFLKSFFAHQPPLPKRKLYIKSDWEPDRQEINIELRARTSQFQVEINKLYPRKKLSINLDRMQLAALRYLQQHKELMAIKSDKNLGPCIIEREKYLDLAYRDHLNDTSTYRQLQKSEAEGRIKAVQRIIKNFINKYETYTDENGQTVPTEDGKYLLKSLQVNDPYAKFYLLAKVHKTPLKTRPIISVSGSLLHGIGRWLDIQLQDIVKDLQYVTKSSFTFVEDLKKLQPNGNWTMFTCDAVSFYTNVDTNHAIKEISDFFNETGICEKHGKNKEQILKAIEIVMKHNLFIFGDTFWLQIDGTAMGGPPAPMYATLYFFIHKRKIIIKYPQLVFYQQYIDDGYGVWDKVDPETEHQWHAPQQDFQSHGKLRWEFSERSKKAVFLDVNAQLINNKFVTNVYEKVLNKYLCIPPKSAHPPGVIKGLICGHLFRFSKLCHNTNWKESDTLHTLLSRLRAQGYTWEFLKQAVSTVQQCQKKVNNKNDEQEDQQQHLFHITYYPKNVPSKELQQIFHRTMREPPGEPHL